jgi:hypothetical protein
MKDHFARFVFCLDMGDVALLKQEITIPHKMRDILNKASAEVVNAANTRMHEDEGIAEPAADEASSTGDYDIPRSELISAQLPQRRFKIRADDCVQQTVQQPLDNAWRWESSSACQ